MDEQQKYQENYEWVCAQCTKMSEDVLYLGTRTEKILEIVEACVKALKAGKKVMFCGNGGSAADCSHIVGELQKGFLKKRQYIPLLLKWRHRKGMNLHVKQAAPATFW